MEAFKALNDYQAMTAVLIAGQIRGVETFYFGLLISLGPLTTSTAVALSGLALISNCDRSFYPLAMATGALTY